MKITNEYLKTYKEKLVFITLIILLSVLSIVLLAEKVYKTNPQILTLNSSLEKTKKEFLALKNQDQYKINQDLKDKIKKSEDIYNKSIDAFEKITDLKVLKQDTADMDKLFAGVLSNLSKLNYASAGAQLTDLNSQIDKKTASLVKASVPTGQSVSTPVAVSNAPPSSGYSYQAVKTDGGTFNVAIIAADLNSTKVIIDTASDGNCTNDCPVLPLGTYAGRSGAFAGINGSFFCPAEYPSCAGKTGSFDTLLMNKNKVYFNSDNNKFSTVPLAYFSGSSMGIRGQTLDWGRDTGVDAVIANTPLYISGGQNVHGGAGDKFAAKGSRTFVASKGSTVYIGIVYNATSGDAAVVLKTLGMDNALGLDQGGSTALWQNGSYLAGPGRNIPNALLFVRK